MEKYHSDISWVMNEMPRPKKPRNPHGKPKTYSDDLFLNALTETTQTTQQVRAVLQQLECCSGIAYGTVLNNLQRLAEEGKVIRREIPAGTGTGIMFLWSK